MNHLASRRNSIMLILPDGHYEDVREHLIVHSYWERAVGRDFDDARDLTRRMAVHTDARPLHLYFRHEWRMAIDDLYERATDEEELYEGRMALAGDWIDVFGAVCVGTGAIVGNGYNLKPTTLRAVYEGILNPHWVKHGRNPHKPLPEGRRVNVGMREPDILGASIEAMEGDELRPCLDVDGYDGEFHEYMHPRRVNRWMRKRQYQPFVAWAKKMDTAFNLYVGTNSEDYSLVERWEKGIPTMGYDA